MYTLEQNDKLGYYTVGTKKFYGKVEALIEATKTKEFPIWHYNRNVFDNVKWQEEPQTPLRELYRMRAQQLREKYDWIRIEASGGGDSTTALLSFLNNGIHIDEVVFRYPKTGEKNVHNDPYNTKCENTLSEWEFAAKPLLNWISTNHPRVKITVHDYSENMLKQGLDDSWVFKTKDYFQPGHCFKHDNVGFIDHRRDAEAGKKICVLYGIDKPRMCVKDNKWFVYFMDLQANHSNSVVYEYDNITNEYFYWSPDLPELVCKQAHIIKNWFMMPQNKPLQFVVKWPNNSIANRTTYEQMVKPLIYPDYDPATFQVIKPSNSFYNEMDYWFYVNFQETQVYKTWQAGLTLLVNSIDEKYFNKEMGKPVGFVGFVSPFYYLGPSVYASTGINDYARFDQAPVEL
jgi:hypothetical protein